MDRLEALNRRVFPTRGTFVLKAQDNVCRSEETEQHEVGLKDDVRGDRHQVRAKP